MPKTFGAKPGKRGQFEAADVPGANLTFTKSDTPTVPTKGRALDHIGFEIKGLEAFCKKLEANEVKLDMPFTNRPDLGISLAFITDPWGTSMPVNLGQVRTGHLEQVRAQAEQRRIPLLFLEPFLPLLLWQTGALTPILSLLEILLEAADRTRPSASGKTRNLLWLGFHR